MVDVVSALQEASIIVLFGPTGSGKTTFANVASGDSMEVGEGLRSCTKEVNPAKMFMVDSKPVIIIDSPGFDDTEESDADILKTLAGFLTTAYTQDYKIIGLLYIHKITDTRVGGSSLQNMSTFKSLCGVESLKNVVYVTNMWSQPPIESELKREKELRESDDFFGWPLSQGAQMARHTNTKESAHDIIRMLLPKQATVPELSRQLAVENLTLDETTAGKALFQGLQREILKLQKKIQALGEEHARASESTNKEWKQKIEESEAKAQERYKRLIDEVESLKQGHKDAEAAWGQIFNEHMAAIIALMIKQMAEMLNEQNQKHEARVDGIFKQHEEEFKKARCSEEERLKKLVQAYEEALAEARAKSRKPEEEKSSSTCIIA